MASTQYYYFEGQPTAGTPFYFSEVITINYVDDQDRANQLAAYCTQLSTSIQNNGDNPLNYNIFASATNVADTAANCQNDHDSTITGLTSAGQTVINVNL
jgi:hypothetical protein